MVRERRILDRPAQPACPHSSLQEIPEAPFRAFGGVIKYLGLEAPRQRIERAIKLSSFRVLQEQEKRHGFRERPPVAKAFFREGKAGQWRKTLNAEQVAAIVTAHRVQMARFDYV